MAASRHSQCWQFGMGGISAQESSLASQAADFIIFLIFICTSLIGIATAKVRPSSGRRNLVIKKHRESKDIIFFFFWPLISGIFEWFLHRLALKVAAISDLSDSAASFSLPLSFPLWGLSFPFCRISLPAEFMILTLQERSSVGGPVLTLPCHHCCCCQVPRRGLAAESLFGDLCKLGHVGLSLLGSFYFGRAPLWQTRAGVLSTKNHEKQNNLQLILNIWVSIQSKPGSQTMCSDIFLRRHGLISVEL